MGTTRSGRPLIGFQTLVDRLIGAKKKTAAAPVSAQEAVRAAKVLEQRDPNRLEKYRDAALVGGAMSPVVRGIGRAVEGAVTHPGNRVRGALEGFRKTTGGEVARHVTEGMLGAGGVKAVQEGVEIDRARRKVVNFVTDSDKTAGMDPMTVAGGVVAGKLMMANALSRHGAKIGPLRRLGQEIAGVGFRTAQQGKPMLSRPLREVLAIGGDPKLMSAYETAHSVGKRVTPEMAQQLREGASHLSKQVPELKDHASFISGVPLESKGWRKAVDYGFTPVGEVARDIKNKVLPGRATPKLAALRGPGRAVAFRTLQAAAENDVTDVEPEL